MNQHQFAPAVPSLQSSDRRPGGSSPGPDATLIINDQMAVRSRGWGVPRRHRCVLPPARWQGRIHVGAVGEVMFGCSRLLRLLTDLPETSRGVGLGAFSQFAGIGERSTALHATEHSSLKSHFKRVSEANPGHFQVSRLNAPNLDRGGHDEIHETPTFGATHDR